MVAFLEKALNNDRKEWQAWDTLLEIVSEKLKKGSAEPQTWLWHSARIFEHDLTRGDIIARYVQASWQEMNPAVLTLARPLWLLTPQKMDGYWRIVPARMDMGAGNDEDVMAERMDEGHSIGVLQLEGIREQLYLGCGVICPVFVLSKEHRCGCDPLFSEIKREMERLAKRASQGLFGHGEWLQLPPPYGPAC